MSNTHLKTQASTKPAEKSMELDGSSLKEFARSVGLTGRAKRGDGESITSDWCLQVKADDVPKVLESMKATFSIKEHKVDGYVTFKSANISGCFQFDCFEQGDCCMVAQSR